MLSEEQSQVIKKIKEFLKSTEVAFSITGAAGTGKTFLMNYLYNKLKNKLPIRFCAPTHKAKLVLEKATGQKAITLHSLLALTPNLDIFELDFNDLLFKSNSNKLEIPLRGLVICDEASMINDELYKILIQKCGERLTKICFVSDPAQLMPVKSYDISLVYKVPLQFNLSKIYRQSEDNAFLNILETLRSRYIDEFTDCIGNSGSLICETDSTKFLANYIKHLKKAIANSDILDTKLTAYTNKRINQFNKIIKNVLFKEEYNKFEFLTGCENFEFNCTKFYNSMDYITCSEPIKKDVYLPYFIKLPGWDIELYDSVEKTSERITILSKDISEDYRIQLAYLLENLRINAIKASNFDKAKKWGMYYKLMQSFATPFNLTIDGRVVKKKTFTEGYACSVHKLQGSSYNSIFVDMKNINTCVDDLVRRQLQYVALSRTYKDAFILQ